MVFIFMVVLLLAFGTIFFRFFFVAAVTDFVLVKDTAFIGFLLMHEKKLSTVSARHRTFFFSRRAANRSVTVST
jgi:hypothetical protein